MFVISPSLIKRICWSSTSPVAGLITCPALTAMVCACRSNTHRLKLQQSKRAYNCFIGKVFWLILEKNDQASGIKKYILKPGHYGLGGGTASKGC